MHLLFVKPTYGPSPDPCFDRSHRAAIMFAANRGVKWVGDLSPDRLGWSAARNSVVREALEIAENEQVDGVFWVDDDIRIPVDTIAKLVDRDVDFISGLYFQRQPPFWPVFARLNKRWAFEWPSQFPSDSVFQCDGVGFGCVFTSTRLLKLVSKLPEVAENGPFGGDFGKKVYGEDFAFCLRARQVDIRPYLDTSIKCQHLIGPEFANEATFRQFMGPQLAAKGVEHPLGSISGF